MFESDNRMYNFAMLFLVQCAKRCLEMNSFICRGFDYEADEENCILYNANAGMVGLTVSINLQFYQLISQAGQLVVYLVVCSR